MMAPGGEASGDDGYPTGAGRALRPPALDESEVLTAWSAAPRGGWHEIEVFVADEQEAEPVDVDRWSALAHRSLVAQGVRGEAEMSLLFVDEVAMAELNHRFLGKSGPTDVLSFPIDDDVVRSGPRSADSLGPGPVDLDSVDAPALLGDVVICPAVARRNAPDHAGTYDDEMALLVVHGVLHVLGMDHAEPAEAEVMEARERELLASFHTGGLAVADPGLAPVKAARPLAAQVEGDQP
ncbi:MAG: rRNA maturation RNase YbeY [Acidimicrobiales bacterium]